METVRVTAIIKAEKFLRLFFFSFSFIFVLSFACFAREPMPIQNIPVQQFPALVYTQEDPNLVASQRTSLMIATIVDGKANIQKFMSAQYISATQLSDTVFLVQADQHPQDRSLWRQTQFLIDFKTGSKELLCDSISRDKLVHYFCLRSVPERNEAVLLRYGQGTDKSTLVHVDLKTLKTKTIFTFPEKENMPGFNGPHVKISPDFKTLAAMTGSNLPTHSSIEYVIHSDFSLQVLDLDTMKTTKIDDKVNVEISAMSSQGAEAPFDWISEDEILYQDMKPVDWNEGEYILKCANIKDNTTIQWLTKQLRLTTTGGNISCDWFTGQVYFNEFLVDIKNKTLLPMNNIYSINRDNKKTEISFNGQLISNYKGYIFVDPCLSKSKKSFACFARFDGNTENNYALYIVTNDMKEPLVITEIQFYTDVIAWIENTGKEN